jgi:hypothetical protein
MSVLPVSNVVNVTIQTTPSGLTEKNVNSLALFTTESPDNLEQYGIYISAQQVADNYGSDSNTAEMANNVFAQSPNVLTGGGRLVIIPLLSSVSATSGNTVTANISANLAALIAVNNGDLKVTLNSVVHNLTGLDFTNCTTLIDIAAVLQQVLPDVIMSANSTAITFTSKTVGTGSTVVIAAVSGGTGTNLAGAGLLNTAASTPTGGAAATGETILQALTRTAGLVGYVPFMTNLNMDDTTIEAIASAVQALDNMFIHHCAATTDIAGLATAISGASDTKTRLVLYTPSQAAANLMKAAYAGRGFSVAFTGSLTSATMNLKSLANVVADPGITQTLYDAADVAGIDLYVSWDGVAGVFSTGGNTYFDNPYSDLAFKFALEAAGFNYLRQTNTKVPQTEPGMNGLKAAYANICNQFIRNGCLAPGSWTSSETFGNPDLFRQNILNYGFYIYSLPIVQQNSTEREQRIAPLVQIAVKRAGAIQKSNVIVLVND